MSCLFMGAILGYGFHDLTDPEFIGSPRSLPPEATKSVGLVQELQALDTVQEKEPKTSYGEHLDATTTKSEQEKEEEDKEEHEEEGEYENEEEGHEKSEDNLHMWLDPFDVDPRRPTDPSNKKTKPAQGIIGPCLEKVEMPDPRSIKIKGVLSADGTRLAIDRRLHGCLAKQHDLNENWNSMLFEAATVGYEMSAKFLVEHGADPLHTFTREDVQQVLSRRSRFPRGEHGNINFLFDPSLHSLAYDKNAVQLAIAGGFSELAQFFLKSVGKSEVDESGRSPSDYVSGRGSAIRPDEALTHMNVAVEHVEPVEILPQTAPYECDGDSLTQQLDWSNTSKYSPYGKCDLDVVDDLTPEQYRRDYFATGKPVVLRNFVDQDARCLARHDRFVNWAGRKQVSVGPTAYPQITGSLSCQRRQTIDELEKSAPCQEYPGVAVYHAEHVQPLAEPLRLENSKYFQNLSEMLNINSGFLTSKQLFYGGDRSGAALHCHSAAFNALYIGIKDWFLIPPKHTALSGMPAEKLWYEGHYREDHVLRCTQNAGDVILVPDGWGHSTISRGFTMGLGVLYSDVQLGRRRHDVTERPSRRPHHHGAGDHEAGEDGDEVSQKIIFVHVNKVGGSSMFQALVDNCRGKHLNGRGFFHGAAQYQRHAVGDSAFWDAYRFGLVRHPWARQVSNFFFLIGMCRNRYNSNCERRFIPKYGGWMQDPELAVPAFHKWIRALHKAYPVGAKDEYFFGSLPHGNEMFPWFNSTQVSWFIDGTGKWMIDHVYKLEEIKTGYAKLQEELPCLRGSELGHEKSLEYPSNKLFFHDTEIQEIMDMHFANDMRVLGYEPWY